MWLSERVLLRAALLLAAATLAGCGFRLQGVGIYPESMANTYIAADNQYTYFYQDLSKALEDGGVRLVSSPLDADTVIRIERDITGRKVLTVNTRNVPTEYDVYYTVEYSVWSDGIEVLPSHRLTLSQDYTYDATLVLGKNREEDTLREAIAQDLVRQVSQELSRLP